MHSKIDMSPERGIILSLITSSEFCKKLIPILQLRFFKTSYAKCIGEWAIEYYTQYETPIGENILNVYADKKMFLREDESEAISDFLASIPSYTESVSITYETERAENYIRVRNLEMMKDELEVAIIENDPNKGESSIAQFTQVGLPKSKGVSLVSGTSEVIGAFMEENEVLFNFPGALGTILPPPMRGDLYAYLGAQKSGKTWALQFTGEQAMQARLRVVHFSLEMRQSQILRRAWQSAVSSPPTDKEIIIPFFKPCFEEGTMIEEDQKRWEIYQRKEFRKGVDIQGIEAYQARMRLLYRGGDIRFVTLPAHTATIEDIIVHLDNLAYYDNYIPDVVIIDYADILLPSKGAPSEERHRLNDIWLKMRSLAMARDILVVTASQANRMGIMGEITAENIAEDIRKLGHVSVMAALNRKKEDKLRSMVRVSTLAQRDGEEALQEAIVLQALGLGRFYMDSRLASQVEMGSQ